MGHLKYRGCKCYFTPVKLIYFRLFTRGYNSIHKWLGVNLVRSIEDPPMAGFLFTFVVGPCLQFFFRSQDS